MSRESLGAIFDTTIIFLALIFATLILTGVVHPDNDFIALILLATLIRVAR